MWEAAKIDPLKRPSTHEPRNHIAAHKNLCGLQAPKAKVNAAAIARTCMEFPTILDNLRGSLASENLQNQRTYRTRFGESRQSPGYPSHGPGDSDQARHTSRIVIGLSERRRGLCSLADTPPTLPGTITYQVPTACDSLSAFLFCFNVFLLALTSPPRHHVRSARCSTKDSTHS